MKLELVFLTLVAGAMAANPQPCCMANRFSAVMFSLGATVKTGNPAPVLKDMYVYLNYDYDNMMVATEVHTLNMTTGSRDKVNVYEMYNMSKRYIATETGQCYWQHMNSTGMVRPCVPANFSYAASFKVGYHDHALLTHTFAGMADKMMTRYTVTTDDCSPIVEAGVGMNDDGNFNIHSNTYADLKQNYNTVGAFLLPSICNHAVDITGHHKRDLEELFDVPLKPSFLQ